MGVSLLSSIHAQNIQDFKSKLLLKNIVENKVFERYIVLSKQNKIGEIVGIYDRNFNKL